MSCTNTMSIPPARSSASTSARGMPWISMTGTQLGVRHRGRRCWARREPGSSLWVNRDRRTRRRLRRRGRARGGTRRARSAPASRASWSIAVAGIHRRAHRRAAVVDAQHRAVGGAPVVAERHERSRRPRRGAGVAHSTDDLRDRAGLDLEDRHLGNDLGPEGVVGDRREAMPSSSAPRGSLGSWNTTTPPGASTRVNSRTYARAELGRDVLQDDDRNR